MLTKISLVACRCRVLISRSTQRLDLRRGLSLGTILGGKCPYETLGVARTASQQDIKKAYLHHTKLTHPDTNPDDKTLHAKFLQVQKAYDEIQENEKMKGGQGHGNTNQGKVYKSRRRERWDPGQHRQTYTTDDEWEEEHRRQVRDRMAYSYSYSYSWKEHGKMRRRLYVLFAVFFGLNLFLGIIGSAMVTSSQEQMRGSTTTATTTTTIDPSAREAMERYVKEKPIIVVDEKTVIRPQIVGHGKYERIAWVVEQRKSDNDDERYITDPWSDVVPVNHYHENDDDAQKNK